MSKELDSTIPRRLFLCGASVRAAAFSALRAGIEPLCADLFADDDLRRAAPTVRVPDYPEGLVAAAAQFLPAAWTYTGALENHPNLVSRLGAGGKLLGNHAAVLARVRDPLAVAHCLQTHRLPALDVRAESHAPPVDGSWVRKPLGRAGGAEIRLWNAAAADEPSPRPVYYQQWAHGTPHSALFLAGPNAVVLIGITRQLVGLPQLNAPPFAYCGSIGPVVLPDSVERTIRAIGACLAEFGEMRGLFGCDFLYDGQTAWLTEVNPRYTASVELFERSWDLPLLGWHCRACLDDAEAAWRPDFSRELTQSQRRQSGVQAKGIVFAQQDFRVPELEHRFPAAPSPWHPWIADLPTPGSTIPAGQPICTLFAEGKTSDEALAQLLQASALIGAAQ